MRICLVYDCLFPHTVGGAERWYRNLAQFTLDWELPHLSQHERDKIFPYLMQQADGFRDFPGAQ